MRYATTDVHGCHFTLRRLVEEKLQLGKTDELYLLGDYVNKGPDSRGVLDYLMHLQAAGYQVQCLRGNHEQLLLDACQSQLKPIWWFRFNRSPTLRSFGVQRAGDIPARYLAWLAALPYELELPDFVLVHAGYNFALPPAEMRQDHATMLNVRKFTYDPSRLGGKRLLHGHVPTPAAAVRKQAPKNPAVLGLDTGCVYRLNPELRCLSAYNLDTGELAQVENCEPPYAIGRY